MSEEQDVSKFLSWGGFDDLDLLQAAANGRLCKITPEVIWRRQVVIGSIPACEAG